MPQSIKSERELKKLQQQLKVMSRRLCYLEEKELQTALIITEISKKTAWLYDEVKDGMSAVLTNACHRIAEQQLQAEVTETQSTDIEKITNLLKGAAS